MCWLVRSKIQYLTDIILYFGHIASVIIVILYPFMNFISHFSLWVFHIELGSTVTLNSHLFYHHIVPSQYSFSLSSSLVLQPIFFVFTNASGGLSLAPYIQANI